jgi:N-acetylglucosaminyldiphosphoundecaprenol N-acetyl-beta-D-mannosaminyltransferase
MTSGSVQAGSPMAKDEQILGFRITGVGSDDLVARIVQRLDGDGRPLFLACANPHSLVEARRHTASREALQSADYLIPDGVGIVMASRILGGRIRQRLTGTDAFLGLSRALDKKGENRCFFLGSDCSTLERIARRFKVDFPRLVVVGRLAPPHKQDFSPDDDRFMVDAVNSVAADILWVGMTALKQEKWVFRNRSRLNVRFIGAIGAVFDFYAGTKRRSPEWALRKGLEWLPRLLWEPRRLWRRTIVSAPVFLWLVLRERLTRRRPSATG